MGKVFSLIVLGAFLSLTTTAAWSEEPVRDPFWPVGYTGAAKAPSAAEEKEKVSLDLSRLSAEQQAIIKSHMRVGGILQRGSQRIAIINSDVVREGDDMRINVDGQSYTFHIKSLQPHNIVLEPKQKRPQPEETHEEEKP